MSPALIGISVTVFLQLITVAYLFGVLKARVDNNSARLERIENKLDTNS